MVLAGLFSAVGVFAQTAAVPAAEQPVYDQLQGKLTAFTQTVTSQWNGVKTPYLKSGELLSADGNLGLLLLGAGQRTKYLNELNALKNLGNTAVVVQMGYPLLYQPFLQFNGDPQDYASIIAFYQQVAADVHAAGMKLIVESSTIFPGFFSQGSSLNITGYYQSISYDEYITGEATMNATIVNEIKPDYLDVGSEPGTVATNTGFTQVSSYSGWAAAVQGFVSMIPTPHPIPIGAGIGTWQVVNSTQYIDALVPFVDYIDIHVYPINDPPNSAIDIPTNTLNVINEALAKGRPVAMSEAWLSKQTDAQYATDVAVASSVNNFSQDVFSFWAPLDQQFINVLSDIANWKNFIYFSPFWTRFYWSYIDYNTYANESAEALINTSVQTSATALSQSKVTSTGLFVQGLYQGHSGGLTLTTAANFNTAGVAPNSIVSIFGSDLAATASVTGSSLPTSLGGSSMTITDSLQVTKPLSFFYTSPLQINALIPSGLANGNATLALTTSSGSVITGNINLMTVNPGIFTKDGSGGGVPAAQVLTYQPNGSSAYTNVFQGSAAPFTALPIQVNAAGTSVYLVLYASGVQGRDSLSNVYATIAGEKLPVSFAGPQGGYSGLDQMNILLPSDLAGKGLVNVQVTVDGLTSNTVQVDIQ